MHLINILFKLIAFQLSTSIQPNSTLLRVTHESGDVASVGHNLVLSYDPCR